MAPKTLEGTWDEIRTHDAELKGRRVKLTIVEDQPTAIAEEENPELRKSTARDLLRHLARSKGWAGDDFEQCLQAVSENRTPARF